MRTGRTIGEKREQLEKSSERAAAHKKNKRNQKIRLSLTILGFICAVAFAVFLTLPLFTKREEPEYSSSVIVPYAPTIEVIDEDLALAGGEISEHMKEYIGQAEADFRELGYAPVRAVIPSGAIREVRFYLDGYNGFIKLITDRGAGVSVEDADRLIRHLAAQGITDFEYLDVRIAGKAYWK